MSSYRLFGGNGRINFYTCFRVSDFCTIDFRGTTVDKISFLESAKLSNSRLRDFSGGITSQLSRLGFERLIVLSTRSS